MTFSEYVASLRNKRITVLGIGVSNTPLIRRLAAAGCTVTARDRADRERLGPVAEELENMGVRLILGENYLEGIEADVIFRTPGLRPDLPQISAAVAAGAELTSEMEAFFRVCPCRIIAVTGSDGKTTTTTIISELLKAAGYTVQDEDGYAIEGYDSGRMFGDSVSRPVDFDAPVCALSGKTVRMEITMKDADLYSFVFRPDYLAVNS